METAVSTEKKTKNELFCKSKIIQNPRKWNRSSASGECGAQVGNRSEKAACGMAEEQGHTNQDAGCPPHAGARRSLLSRTQLHRLSTIFTSVLSPCSPLRERPVSRIGGRGGSSHKLLLGPGHGNVYVSRRPPLPSLPLSSLPSHARAAARAAFVLLQG